MDSGGLILAVVVAVFVGTPILTVILFENGKPLVPRLCLGAECGIGPTSFVAAQVFICQQFKELTS
jgi:hypothetical protein